VRASELAAVRVPSVAAEARRVAAAHGGIAAQLSFAGRRLDLLPPAALPADEQARLLAVRNADDVGAAWRRLVGEQLARCERDESDYAARGTSPTLRPVARFALGVCREELALIRR
jgi:putative membrane protein